MKYFNQFPGIDYDLKGDGNQTIVTDIIDDAKDTWDNDNVDGETSAEKILRLGAKPTDITLP